MRSLQDPQLFKSATLYLFYFFLLGYCGGVVYWGGFVAAGKGMPQCATAPHLSSAPTGGGTTQMRATTPQLQTARQRLRYILQQAHRHRLSLDPDEHVDVEAKQHPRLQVFKF